MHPFELLSEADVQHIHETSMRLLAQVGVNFPQPEALAIFQQHGARIEATRVFLTEAQVMDALKTVPAEFTIAARNPTRNVMVGHGKSVFAPGYGAPFLVDPEVGKRAATLDDYHTLARLSHALPNQDLSGHLLVDPESAPAAHMQMLYAHMVQASARCRDAAAATTRL